MACTSQSASEYIKNGRKLLVGKLHDLPLIVENLFQSKVLHEEEVRKIQTEVEQFDKTEEILDWVMEKGEAACYELLVILDRTKKKTLDDPDLEHWISCFPFREDLEMTDHLVGLKPCQRYQTLLKRKAQKIAEDARKQSCGLLPESCRKEVSFSYTPLVLDTDVYSTLSKIKLKSKKGRKTRHKKLKSFIPVARQETSLAGLLDTNESKILLVGKPGIGKTTVTHQMLRLWSEKDHRELDYMFYFNMRDISFRTNPRCLEDLLFNMYCEPEESREEVLEDIKKNSENAVIIFDGITDLSSNLVIKELLSHKLLPDAKIVITCRPEVHFEDFLTDFPTDWFRVEVKGFCDESIKAYLTKMLNAQPESLNSVLNNLELFSLCHVPMYALMVVACICSTPEASKQSWTTTTMYINILRHCIQEHSGKQLKDSQCLAEHREKILSLAEIAYKATEQKTMNLATLSHEEGSPQCAFLGAVMVKVLPTYSAFLHHTMQEFFGALWLLQNPDRIRDVLKKCQTKEWNHLMYLVPYLCGLLNEMNICLVDRLVPASQIKLTSDWFFKKLVKTFLPPERYNDHADCSATEFEIDLVFLCQCLYESQSSVACLLFLEKMDYHLDLSGEHLDPHHCCAVSYVISQSAENKVGLDLDSCTVSEQGLRLILGSLKNVRYLGSTPSILCQLWITLLSVEEEMDFTSLLGLCENELHLPVQAESRVFERAEDVMKQSSERVNLCLHWNQRTLLSEALNKTILECLSNINKLSFAPLQDQRGSLESLEKSVLLHLCLQAAFYHRETFLGAVNTLLSMFSVYQTERYDILLDLYSYVKNKINQSDRSLLLLLTPLYQSAPAVWSIDLSERKTSLLLEVLKLQPEKKLVELKGWSDEESEVRSFLQCLPYISQLSFYLHRSKHSEQIQFLVDLLSQAAEWEEETGEKKLKLVSSVCSYSTFPFRNWDSYDEEKTYQSEFLLDLYSHVKDYETQTGRSVLPSLQPVYQSASPAVWSIDLSERKTSFLLEVLKLQPEKKPVKLKGWSDEESEVRSFLQCLPYISQLSFTEQYQRRIPEEWRQREKTFLLNVCLQAVINEQRSLQTTLETVLSVFEVCQYQQWDLVLDLYSYVKDYETHTGRSVLPALQPVYQSAPPVWSIDLSERKTSILLEVLKLQPEKKPVVLKGWSDEESDVRSFLQCLPYISQLSCDDQFFLCLCEALSVGSEWDAHLCTSLLHAVDYTVVLSGWLPSVTCRTVGAVLGQSASGGKLNITLTPQSMSFQGARQLFKKVENLHKLRVNEMAVLKLARMAKFGSCHNPVLIEEMILDLSSPAVPEGVLRRVISSLASLLRCWPIRSLDLTDCQIEGYLLTSLLCHQGHLCTFRLNGESMQQLTDVVYEAQDKELTQCFLVKFGHDLSYCTLNWDVLQYLLQSTTQPITVNLRRSQFKPKDIIHLLPCLTNIHFKRINSRFKRTALREIYKQRAGHMVTTLLKSSDEWINLNNLVLDRYDCEALRFALHYSDGVKLNLLWTIVPKTEMRNILGLLHRVLTLRIDRELLLELLHACRDFGLQKTAVDLLRLLDHKLDLSCSSAMDLSRQEEGTVLSLTTGDCMVIASAVQVADCNTEINLHDCQVGNAGLEELIPVLHRVHLSIGKQILLQFLHLISVRDGDRSGRLALFLSRALGKELDLSQTPLDLVACSSLALILEYSEGLSELDLHNCNLTDNHLNCLLMHLHKVQVLNLSNNEVTDQGAIYVKDKLSRNGFTGTVWLHSRKATKPDNVLPEDKRYKVCLTYGESKRFSKTKAHFKEFDPVMKLVEGRISYSFQFGSRGRFKCTATGLIFGMKEPGTMEYSVEDWDMGILANTSYEPAGPLFQLNSPEGDIYQLQLPHCETEVYSAEDLHVAHMCINNMEFLRPKKVTQSHVIVAICGLSRFGNVRKRPFYQNRVQVKVGLFLEPDVTPTRQRLWVFLLPRNVPFTEVKEQHKEFVFIKTSPYCILRPKAKYSLTSDLKLGFKVQPKKYILHFDSSNDHHATFEVFLNHDITELHLKIQERTRLKALIRWSRLVILKTKSAKVSVQKLTESQWIESLCSILEQLTNKQMKKLKSLMMTTKERSHISKSTLEGLEDHCDVAQQMVWAWGMNGSIMATREFMDKLQRQDECVMSLLQPFLDQCDPM